MAKVLFVEEDYKKFLEVRDLIREHSFDIAFSGWEGIGAAMMYTPDVILMNLEAPIVEGVELLRLLKTEETINHLKIVGYTFPKNEAVEQVCMQGGCFDLVDFPFEHDTLLSKLESALAASEKEKADKPQITEDKKEASTQNPTSNPKLLEKRSNEMRANQPPPGPQTN